MPSTAVLPLPPIVSAAVLAALGCLGAGRAQRQLIDLNRTPGPPGSSSPAGFVAGASGVWFAASASAVGRELWHIDAQGAVTLAADLVRGSGDTLPESIRAFGTGVAFVAAATTPRGAYTIAALGQVPRSVGPWSADVLSLAVAGNNLFMVADSRGSGVELYVSRNGSAATLTKDINPGAGHASVAALMAFGERVLFVADDGVHGYEWWVSDGTPDGTLMLLDAMPGAASGAAALAPFVRGGLAYFTVADPTHGAELWVTDGLPSGTRLLADLVPGAVGSYPSRFAALPDGRFAFVAVVPGSGSELFVSDGTPVGTQLLDLWPGPLDATVGEVVGTPSGVFLVGNAPGVGRELVRTDGTLAGTMVLDLTPGPAGSNPSRLVAGGRGVFALLAAAVPGRLRLMSTDGTLPGTRELRADLGGGLTTPGLAPVGAGVAFAAATAAVGIEPWISDDSVAGTRLARDIEVTTTTLGSSPVVVGSFAGRAVFVADDGAGPALWSTDGLAAHTVRLLACGTDNIESLAALQDGLLLSSSGVMYRTDGTRSGTWALPVPVAASSGFGRAAALVTPARAVFVGAAGGVYATDGTVAGTVLLTGVRGSDCHGVDGVGYFIGVDAQNVAQIYRTDGTAAGTRPFAPIERPSNSGPKLFGVVGGRVIHGGSTGVFSVGATGSSVQLSAQPMTTFSSESEYVGDRLVFGANVLLATDGSVAGTTMLSAALPARIAALRSPSGPRVLVYQTSVAAPFLLTDGTLAGTTVVPLALPFPSGFVRVSETQVAFGVPTTGTAAEIMVSDGSLAGTRAIGSLRTGNNQGLVTWTAVAADGQLFFRDAQAASGTELYVADLGAAAHAEGHGCSAVGVTARLAGSEPRLGGVLHLSASPSRAAHLLMLGLPAAQPVQLGGAAPCALFLAPTQPQIVLAMPNGAVALPLPTQLELIGQRLMAQAWSGPSASPLGADLSNGLRLVLGY